MHEEMAVLVIDDDAMVVKLLENALSKKGFRVFSAANGLDGLDIARSEVIDVILLDWMMPEMDGIEVLSELKRDSNTLHIPVIMLTGKEDSRDIDHAINKGAVDYIVKPFNTYQVPQMVQQYLEKAHHGHSHQKQGFFSRIFCHH